MDSAHAEAAMLVISSSGGNGANVKPAEAFLRRLVASRGGPPILCSLLEQSPAVAVRHLAAVLLRKRVTTYWSRCRPDAKQSLQTLILTQLTAETERPVRRALVGIAAALGKVLLPGGNWPELLSLMQRCARHEHAEARELGLLLVLELTGSLGARTRELLPTAAPALASGLADATSRAVRVAALRAMGALLRALDDRRDVARFRPLVPGMLAVTREALEHDEAAAVAALDALAELVEARSPVLARYTDELAALAAAAFADVAHDPGAAARDGRAPAAAAAALGLDEATRRAAAQLLIELVAARPAAFTPVAAPALRSLVGAVLSVLVLEYDAEAEAAAERAARRAGVERDGDDGSLTYVAEGVADALAGAVSATATLRAVTAVTPSMLADGDGRRRRAALALIGATVDGAADAYAEALGPLFAAVLPCARDSDGAVREALAVLLARLAEACPARVHAHHAAILPPVFNLLADPSPSVARWGCAVVESFVEALAPALLEPYLEPFLGRLTVLLTARGRGAAAVAGAAARDAADDALGVQETAAAALASAAIAAGPRFTPHLALVLPPLLAALAGTDAPLLPLRAKALEASGHIAEAVGASVASQVLVPALLSSASAAFELGDAVGSVELSTNAFAALACLVRMDGAAEPGRASCVTDVAAAALLQRAIDALVSSDGVELAPAGENGGDDDDGGAHGVAARLEDGDDAAAGVGGGGGGVARVSHASDDDEVDGGMNATAAGSDGGGGDGDVDDDETGGASVAFRVRTSYMELKMAAIHFCGTLADVRPLAVAPRLRELTVALEGAADYFHDEVREQAVAALPSLVAVALAVAPPLPPAMPGEAATLVDIARATLDTVSATLLSKMRNECSSDVVAHACAALARVLKLAGRAAVANGHGTAYATALLSIAAGTAACGDGRQRADDDDDGDDESDEEVGVAPSRPGGQQHSEWDGDGSGAHQAVTEAFDALVSVADAMGALHFAPFVAPAAAAATRFAQAHSPTEDVAMAVGFFGELAGSSAAQSSPAFGAVAASAVPLIVAALASPSARVRRNAAYAAGALVERALDSMRPLLPTLLRALQPGVAAAASGAMARRAASHGASGVVDEDELLFRDNAVAALARIAAAAPDAVPLDDALSAVLVCLPLAADRDEDSTVYGAVISLLVSRRPEAMRQLSTIVAACGAALVSTSLVAPTVRTAVVASGLRRFLVSANADERVALAHAATALPVDMRAALDASVA